MLYDIEGNALLADKVKGTILVGAVLDATSEANRFPAMKQLFDIAKRRINNPSETISDNDFTYATKGCVALFPTSTTAMCEKAPLNIVYSKAETTQAVPASTVKMMSLITGMDYVADINARITIKSTDVESGSGPAYAAGDTMTIRELMLSMMLPSSNTAAHAFGRICGEAMLNSIESGQYTDSQCYDKFISQMNVKANDIGMTNSVFISASGGGSGNYMTASDMVRLAIEGASYPEICKVWNKKSYTVSVGGDNARNVTFQTTVANANFENDYYIYGGKTGSLGAAEALIIVGGIKRR